MNKINNPFSFFLKLGSFFTLFSLYSCSGGHTEGYYGGYYENGYYYDGHYGHEHGEQHEHGEHGGHGGGRH